jgi:hypothetical protein
VRKSQPRLIRRQIPREPGSGDPGIRWLLLNTLATNRSLKGAGSCAGNLPVPEGYRRHEA